MKVAIGPVNESDIAVEIHRFPRRSSDLRSCLMAEVKAAALRAGTRYSRLGLKAVSVVAKKLALHLHVHIAPSSNR